MSESQLDLLERVSAALRAADVSCWEFSYVEERFTWFDRLPFLEADPGYLEQVNRQLLETIFPEDDVAIRDATTKALAEGATTLSSVLRRWDAEGKVRHYRLVQRFFRDDNGRPLRAVGTSRDITAEVKAGEMLLQQTERLQETQRRLDRASLSIQEGHWELELPSGRHWASTSYLALLGLESDSDALSTLDKVRQMIHPDDLSRVREATDAHLAGGEPYDVDARMCSADGHHRWFRVRGSAERNTDGVVVRLSGSVADIQMQRATEDALREAQARFARAIGGTQQGLWEVDLERGTMWLSPRLSQLLGFEPGELADHHAVLRERVHPDDVAITDARIAEAARRTAPIDLEIRMLTKSGEYRWFRMRGTPPIACGRERFSSGSIEDVTEARAAKDALILATEAAEAANRAKSGFLANVSHEIRTPMNGIIGMTRLLLDTALDATQRDYSETIRSSADSLLTVINDILDFSKIEAGKLNIEMLEMDLPANIEDVGSLMAFQAASKDIELIMDVQPDVPRHLIGDAQRIRQCLVNLIGNALKFTHRGEVVCEVSSVSDLGAEVHIRFAVRDTGIGIAPATLTKLFQPFTQADASTTRHYGGTGLGLSIVRRLADLMGGSTGVDSALGEGSTFWFTLPLKRGQPPSRQPTVLTLPAARRVLVVEDNLSNQRVLHARLTHAGYAVTVAPNAETALASLRDAVATAAPFDVALVDHQMPGMDGVTLGRTINAESGLSSTRIVLLTSMDRNGDLERFASLGFAGCLAKPIKGRELLLCLDRVMAREAKEWHLRTQPIVSPNATRQAAAAAGFSGKVLLVEDNIVNQKVARRFLERLGCEVTVAGNGEEGVSAYVQTTHQIILMDVQMPVMDGYAATQCIRELEVAGTRIPIVALTANAMEGQLERCLEAGMDGLLTKPLDIDKLQESLRRYGLAKPLVPVSAEPERAVGDARS